MASSIIEFPVEELQACLRNDLANSTKFVRQANDLNSAWIYEIVKLCHNTIFQTKELPTTKLNALLLVKDLMQTCQVPCIQLIEVYILPIVYKIAIDKPQDKGERRGSTFFHNTTKPRIPNIQQVGIKFLALCSEFLFAGSFIKPNRNFQSVELNQKSQFYDYFEKFKKYGISGIPEKAQQLKFFSNQFKQNGRKRYQQSLVSFYNSKNNYAQYFVTKIIQSIENESNPLMNTNQSVSSIANDLDMRKLLKHGDTILTSPLIEELLLRLNNDQSFMVKKNALSLLTDFVKWGDGQAFAKVCYDTSLENIGKRIAQVNGSLGLGEGEKIYPQVKGQRDGKRKFYAQYLKSLQMISNCLQNQKLQIGEAYRIKDLYNYLKKQKKFQFPQNLMAKRIETELHQYLSNNQERNYLVLKKMREQNGSGNKQKKSKTINSSLYDINRNFQQCLEEIVRLTVNQQEVETRMTKIIKLKQRYEGDIQKLAETSQLEEDQFQQILENEQELNKIVQKLASLHSNYKSKTIDYKQFKAAHASLTKDFDIEQIIQQSLRNDRTPHSNIQLKQSQDVVNSFNVNKNHASTSPELNNVQIDKNTNQAKNAMRYTKNDPSPVYVNGNNTNISNNIPNSRQHPQANNTILKINKVTNNNLNTVGVKNNQSKLQKNESNLSRSHEHDSQQQIINQVTSSIINNKQKNAAPSNTSEIKRRSKQQQSILQQRVSQIKQRVANVSKMSMPIQVAKLNNEHAASKQGSSNQQVEYVEYFAPQSIKLSKNNNYKFNNTDINANGEIVTQKPSFEITAPALIKQNKSSIEEFNRTNQTGDQKLYARPPTFDANQHEERFIQQPQISKIKSDNRSDLKEDNPNKLKQPSVKKVITQGGFAGLKERQPQFHTQTQWNKDNKLYQMYKQDLKQNRTTTDYNYGYNKQNPAQQYYSQGLPQDKISQKNQSNGHFSQRDSFYTCRQSQNQSSISKKSVPITPISQSKNFMPPGELRSSKSSSYHSVQNKDSFHTISLSRNLNNYYVVAADDDDYIRQPQYEPLQNSYYGTQDIVAKLSSSPRPNFKDCLQIDKQIMPSPIRNSNFFDVISNNQSFELQNKQSRLSNNSCSKVSQHEQYLLAKLRRENNKESNKQVKELSNNVIGLKLQNSKIRNQLMRKQSDNSYGSRSNSKSSRSSQNSVVSFSRSHNSNGFTARLGSNSRSMSPLPSTMIKGEEVNESFYKSYLSEMKDTKLKKSCLKNKSILIENEQYEIGCVFKNYYPQPVASISIYFTPKTRIRAFKYSITKEPQLEIDSYCKNYDDVPENKQIKIEVNCRLLNPVPYNLPMVNMSFRTQSELKNCSFYLPVTINKFLVPFNIDQINQNLIQIQDSQQLLRTQQFILNRKVAKVDNISSFFPSMQEIVVRDSSKVNRYASKYSMCNESLILFISTKGKDRIILQAASLSGNARTATEFLLLSLKQILQA